MASHNAHSLPPDSSLRVMEPDLSCSICYDLLKDPRNLNCPHVYCLSCLQKWVGNQPTVECPECRRVTVVPHEGLGQLPQNLRLRNMVEKYSAHGEVSAVRRRRSVPVCEVHEGEKKHFFCVTCGVTVCRDCLVLNHPKSKHDIQDLSKVVKLRKAASDSLLSNIRRQVDTYKQKQASLVKALDKIKHDEATELRRIEQRTQAIVCDANAKGNALKLRVSRECNRERDQLQEYIDKFQGRVQKLDDVYSATRKILLSDSADHVYMTEHGSMVDTLRAELEFGNPVQGPIKDVVTCHYHPGPSISENRLIGQLTTKRALQFLAEFGHGSCSKAQGIASNAPGSFAVADSNYGRVSVYHLQDNDGEYHRQFCLGSSKVPLGKLTNPCGVAVGLDDKFVVTDRSKAVVNIYKPSGHFEKAFESSNQWSQSTEAQPSCVAIAPNGMIVVGDNSRDAITVHSPTGDLVRTFQIRTKGINQIATNGRQIAYSKTDLDLGKVFIVNFDSGQDLKELEITYPTSICFDDRSGSLLIGRVSSEVGSGSIEQYCQNTLTHINTLADGLFMPLSMTVTASDELAVADCKSVIVYKMI